MAGISVRERVNSISGVEINTVIINEEKDTSMYDLDSTIGGVKYFFQTLFSQGPYIFVQADQKLAWLLSLDNSREKYLSSTDYTEVDVLSQAKKIPCTPRSENGWNIIPSDIVDQVVPESDVFIRFGFGLLTGEILSRPQYGVLSAHTADIREIRGLGPQIQFLRNKREAAVTLQQLNNDVDGGKIVHIGKKDLPDNYTMSDIWATVRKIQIGLYAEGIQKLRDPEFEPKPPAELGEYYGLSMKRSPSFSLKLVIKNNTQRLKKLLE